MADFHLKKLHPLSRLKRLVFRLVTRLKLSEDVYLMALAAVVGVLGGFGAVGFRYLIELAQSVFYGVSAEQSLPERILLLPWYWKIAIPGIGAALLTPITYFFAREAKGHGVPEVMERVALGGSRLRPRLVIAKALASALCIGSGGSAGREGPIVQIGSTIGSSLGQFLGVPPSHLKILVGCGAAAGIAATFNAPIAGPFFAMEIIIGVFALEIFGPLVIASVTAAAIPYALFGSQPVLGLAKDFEIAINPAALPFFLGLGLFAGAVAALFIMTLHYSEEFWERLPVPDWVKPAAGALLVGCIALWIPNVLGIGYETIEGLVREGGSPPLVSATGTEAAVTFVKIFLLFAVLKIVATTLTLGSGGSGGIFAPSLFLGAALGAAVGHLFHMWFPGFIPENAVIMFAIVGMGGVVSATTNAPITAILIMFDLTWEHRIILPLMITCIIANLVRRWLQKESIYTIKLFRRGIDITATHESRILKKIKVHQLMHKPFNIVRANANYEEVLRTFFSSRFNVLFVVDANDKFLGTISAPELKAIQNGAGVDALIAYDFMNPDLSHAGPDDTLAYSLERFWYWDLELLPVTKEGRLVGVLTRRDIREAYDKEILKMGGAIARLPNVVGSDEPSGLLKLPETCAIEEIPVPKKFVGKTMRDMRLRERYNLHIISIRNPITHTRDKLPLPGHVLAEGDILFIIGEKEDLEHLHDSSL